MSKSISTTVCNITSKQMKLYSIVPNKQQNGGNVIGR